MARIKEGAFIEIPLRNGMFSYGRILGKAAYAFYDIYSDSKVVDITSLQSKKVLFIVGVYNHGITKNRWKTIGVLELEQGVKKIPLAFIQDSIEPNKFKLYDPNTGEIKPATKSQCIGLECAAVWEPEHVEDRIVDYYEGRPNKWFESLKIKD